MELEWYTDGMRATIDKAGRVVIPAPIREKGRLAPGTELEVTLEDGVVCLTRAVPGPELVRRGERLVARPTAETLPEIDFTALIEEERDRWP